MTVLIVDDQVNSVNGLVAGIDWKKISISKVYKAYNAEEAKRIITLEKIDILLSDIEMPGGSGLDLLRWIKEQNKNIECIFLTAHANFAYAKEAVKLGGFDYILQPARYEDVQNAIVRVKQKISASMELQEYSTYGKMMYEKKDLLLERLLRDWLLGETAGIYDVLADLKQFQINLNANSLIDCVLVNIIRWSDPQTMFQGDLLRYAFNNILSELFGDYGAKVLFVQISEGNYAALAYDGEDTPPDSARVMSTLKTFLQACRDYLGCYIACYTGESLEVRHTAGRIGELLAFKEDNVALRNEVFYLGRSIMTKLQPDYLTNIKKWQQNLIGGNAMIVKKETFAYLDGATLNAQALKRFYQDFMQMVAAAAEESGVSIYQIFSDKAAFEKSLVSYQSIDSMKELIDRVTAYFEKDAAKDNRNYVELVIQYINRNIEKDLRRSDIARMVNLNEDYLSRIFKNEMNVSLKEFIILEKMKVAKSLLKTTNFPVGTIAAKVGFTNFSHFSQMYKKINGVAPVEDRH